MLNNWLESLNNKKYILNRIIELYGGGDKDGNEDVDSGVGDEDGESGVGGEDEDGYVTSDKLLDSIRKSFTKTMLEADRIAKTEADRIAQEARINAKRMVEEAEKARKEAEINGKRIADEAEDKAKEAKRIAKEAEEAKKEAERKAREANKTLTEVVRQLTEGTLIKEARKDVEEARKADKTEVLQKARDQITDSDKSSDTVSTEKDNTIPDKRPKEARRSQKLQKAEQSDEQKRRGLKPPNMGDKTRERAEIRAEKKLQRDPKSPKKDIVSKPNMKQQKKKT